MSDKDNNNSEENKQEKVISLADRLKKVTATPDTSDAELDDIIKEGHEFFNSLMENSTGFVAIVFDTDGNPDLLHSGKLDLIKTLGTIEILKSSLMKFEGLEYEDDDIYD